MLSLTMIKSTGTADAFFNLLGKEQKRFFSSNHSGSATVTKYKLSHARGDAKNLNKSLGQFFEEKVAQYEHKDILRHVQQNFRWTYLELKKNIDGVGNGLLDLGIKRGQKLGIMLHNESENVVTQIAAAKTGMASVIIPPTTATKELETILKQNEVAAVIFNPKRTQADFKQLIPELPYSSSPVRAPWQFPSLQAIISIDIGRINGTVMFREIVNYNRRPDLVSPILPTVKAEETASLFVAPSASYTHTSILATARLLATKLGLGTSDRVCVTLPFSSTIGQAVAIYGSLESGSVVVIPAVQFDVEETVKAIAVEKCSTLVATLEQLQAIAAHPKKNLDTLKKALIVASSAESASVQQLLNGLRISSYSIVSPTEGLLFDQSNSGVLLPSLEAKIVDNKGSTVPVNTVGELVTKQNPSVDSWSSTKLRAKMDETGTFTKA